MPKPITIILLIAPLLRLTYVLAQDHTAPFDRAGGSDTWWYLEYGYRQVVDVQMEPLSTAPLYVLLVGGVRLLLQPASDEVVTLVAPPGGGLDVVSVPGVAAPAAVIAIRVLQALLSTAVVYFVYRTARALADDERVGLVAAAVMAGSVAMLVSAAEIQTETLYLFFLTAALMLYTELSAGAFTPKRPLLWFAVCGGLFGLATLTRAVLLLYPLGLLLHALLLRWRGNTTQITVRGVALLLAVYIAVGSVWTGYYALRWGEFVVGAKGMTAFFYLGTQGSAPPPEVIDEALGATSDDPINDADFAAGAAQTIASAPLDYAARRAGNLLAAYAQPYGTANFPGESLRALVFNWLHDDGSPAGFVHVVRGDAFLPKLLLYLVHYGGLVLGLIGMWLCRARWRVALPLLGFVLYVTLLHLVLLALPRYLFPLLPVWWCFGAVAAVRMWDVMYTRRK